MPFQALTGAPTLRQGATLNIMPYPQIAGLPPEQLAPGTHLTLRFGNCCPLVKQARVTAVEDNPDRVVLILDGTTWALERDGTGVAVPGIVSENWIVRAP